MKTKEDIALYWMKQNSMTLQQRFWEAMEEYRLQSHTSPMSAEQVEDISKTIFASIDHYREAGRDDEFNIKSIAEYLQRHFATTPSVKAEGWVSVDKEKEFQKVLKCLKNNKVMVGTREDGIYIRLAGRESEGEAFTLHFALAYPFPKLPPHQNKNK